MNKTCNEINVSMNTTEKFVSMLRAYRQTGMLLF